MSEIKQAILRLDDRTLNFEESGLAYVKDWIKATDGELEAQGILKASDVPHYEFEPRARLGAVFIRASRIEPLDEDVSLTHQTKFRLVRNKLGEFMFWSPPEPSERGPMVRVYNVDGSLRLALKHTPRFINILGNAGLKLSAPEN